MPIVTQKGAKNGYDHDVAADVVGNLLAHVSDDIAHYSFSCGITYENEVCVQLLCLMVYDIVRLTYADVAVAFRNSVLLCK